MVFFYLHSYANWFSKNCCKLADFFKKCICCYYKILFTFLYSCSSIVNLKFLYERFIHLIILTHFFTLFCFTSVPKHVCLLSWWCVFSQVLYIICYEGNEATCLARLCLYLWQDLKSLLIVKSFSFIVPSFSVMAWKDASSL